MIDRRGQGGWGMDMWSTNTTDRPVDVLDTCALVAQAGVSTGL